MHRRYTLPFGSFMPGPVRAGFPVALPLYKTDGDGDGGDGGNGGGKGGSKKPKLADLLEEHDLQDEFDEMLTRRLKRDRRERTSGGAGKGGGKDEDALAELEALRAEKADREAAELTRKGEFDKLLNLEKEKFGAKETSWKSREQRLTDELRKERVRGRLIATAQKLGAIDPDDVAEMLEKRVGLNDEFKTVIFDAKDPSKTAIDDEGDDLTIEGLVEGFLAKKPHLAKAADGDGAGARGGASGSDEGAARGGRGGKGTGDLARLQKAAEEATARATAQPSAANLTASRVAQRALRAAMEK